jgi:hypothetical protein
VECGRLVERKKKRPTPVSRRALRGHSINEDQLAAARKKEKKKKERTTRLTGQLGRLVASGSARGRRQVPLGCAPTRMRQHARVCANTYALVERLLNHNSCACRRLALCTSTVPARPRRPAMAEGWAMATSSPTTTI